MGYRDVVLSDRPSSYWRLNESTGTTAVDLAGGRNGTYTGTVTLLRARTIADPQGGATGLDGSTAYTTVPNNAVFSSSSFSVEGWVNRLAAGGATQVIITKGQAAAFEWDFFLVVASFANFTIYNTAAGGFLACTDTIPLFATGRSMHFVGTMDGVANVARLYHDGQLTATASATSGTRQGAGAAPVNIGRRADNNFFASAAIGEAAYYNYVLGPGRVRAHYLAGLREGVGIGR